MPKENKDAEVTVKKQDLKSNINEPPTTKKQATYKNSSHLGRVFQFLQYYRNAAILCDIKLETADGKIIFGHKVVFISASPYFRAMFTSCKEINKDHINMGELNSTVLQLLVDYMYTGEITITEENVQDMLLAADLLQLDYVKRACVGSLQKHLGPSNCLGIKAFADIYNCTELLSICEEFIKNQFLEVVKYDEFLSLSSEEVIRLISCDDISVPFEEKVFECVINWVKHEFDCRKDFLPDLMEHVRLPLVSKEYILEKVVDEPLLKNNPKCKDYVFEALHFNLIKLVQPFTIPQTIRSKARQCTSLEKVVLVLSLSSSHLPNKLIINWYDPATNRLKIAPALSKLNMAGGLSVIRDQFVFVVGGAEVANRNIQNNRSTKCFRYVEMLDVSSQSLCWVSKVEMSIHRKSLGIGAIDNCIYALGGCNDVNYRQEYLNSVEVFDFSTEQWRMVSSMSSKRSHFGVGVLNNLLYAVGGFDGTYYLNSVECYDPSQDKWNPVANMSVVRYEVSVGVLDGKIYAIGGTITGGIQNTAEAYNPGTGCWKSIPNMHLGRQSAGVFALDGLLYVVGGKNGTIYHDSVEIYNPKTNSWSMKTLSTNHLSMFSAVVVNKPPHLILN